MSLVGQLQWLHSTTTPSARNALRRTSWSRWLTTHIVQHNSRASRTHACGHIGDGSRCRCSPLDSCSVRHKSGKRSPFSSLQTKGSKVIHKEPLGSACPVPFPSPHKLRIATFNVLAPCYKAILKCELPEDSNSATNQQQLQQAVVLDKVSAASIVTGDCDSRHPNIYPQVDQVDTHTTLMPKPSESSYLDRHAPGTLRESERPELYRKRHEAILSFLEHHQPLDILCLQEYWFNKDFRALYETNFKQHRCYTLKRPDPKQDGVAIFVGPHLQTIATRSVHFETEGERVALLLHLRIRDTSMCDVLGDVIVANTHLIFPHDMHSNEVQVEQVRQLTQAISEFEQEQGVYTSIITGDFNSDAFSPPLQFLYSQGFESLFGHLHQRELAVTHLSHRGDELGVDFVLFRSTQHAPGFEVHNAAVLPENIGDETWPEQFKLSDHRPVVVDLWCSHPP
eukprot:m.118185 g.118185  ORF g.118185 m.118185 type:complete len:453 (+) comp13647_c0_seq4:86-1444(+)